MRVHNYVEDLQNQIEMEQTYYNKSVLHRQKSEEIHIHQCNHNNGTTNKPLQEWKLECRYIIYEEDTNACILISRRQIHQFQDILL